MVSQPRPPALLHGSVEVLLNPEMIPQLKNLVLGRIFLDVNEGPRVIRYETGGYECVIYPLIGNARISIDSRPGTGHSKKVGPLEVGAGRRAIFPEDPVEGFSALRIPHGPEQHVFITTDGIFDALILTCHDDMSQWRQIIVDTPLVCHDWDRQLVGRKDQNTFREVWHLVRPEGFCLDVGETHNEPGMWSSYPAHADAVDLQKVKDGEREWEEVFFCILEPRDSFALMKMDGVYKNGVHAMYVQEIRNGHALATPFGRHPIVAAPHTNLWYFWGYYGNALRKTYNKRATDTGTYVK